MRFLTCGAVLLSLTALIVVAAEDKKKDKDDVIVINIEGKGKNSKYIKEGDKEQKDVTVIVGQTVKWVNKSNAPHTATSDLKVKDKPLFDTKRLNPKDKPTEASILFDEQKYKDAGGKDGKPVPLSYHCEIHPEMMSNIILMPAHKKDKDKDK